MNTIMATPTDSKSTFYEISAFLKTLQEYPGGPHVCTAPISFTDGKEKTDWVKYFPDSLNNQKTYSQLFNEKIKDNTSNRVALFQRPVEGWVAVPKEKNSWTEDDWHALAIAWIKKPNVTYGKDLVIFDVEPRTVDEGERLRVPSLPTIRNFIKYCRTEKPIRQINNSWYSQDLKHKGEDKCLTHSLEWFKRVTLMGDQELSNVDWESLGFKRVKGFHSHINTWWSEVRQRAAATGQQTQGDWVGTGRESAVHHSRCGEIR